MIYLASVATADTSRKPREATRFFTTVSMRLKRSKQQDRRGGISCPIETSLVPPIISTKERTALRLRHNRGQMPDQVIAIKCNRILFKGWACIEVDEVDLTVTTITG